MNKTNWRTLTDIGYKLKLRWYSSNTNEYVKLYKREQRYLEHISKFNWRSIKEDFNEQDILYIKSIEIWK